MKLDRRFAVVCSAITGVVALGPATTAHAHGDTIHLTLTGFTNEHPQFTAVWDKDPVEDRIAGTMNATAPDGTSVGPWRLVPVPRHPGSPTTDGTLPRGHWNITVATALPGPGQDEDAADVPATDTPASAATSEPATGTPDTVSGPAPAGPTAAVTPPAPVAVPANTPTARSEEHTALWRRVRATAAVTMVSIAAIAVAVALFRRSVGSRPAKRS